MITLEVLLEQRLLLCKLMLAVDQSKHGLSRVNNLKKHVKKHVGHGYS